MAKRFFGIHNECDDYGHLCVGGVWTERERVSESETERDNIMEHLSMRTRDMFAKILCNRKSPFKVL